MSQCIIIHPHAHLDTKYIQVSLAQVFGKECPYNQCGNGIQVWRGANEQAEMYALELLKCWIPTHLSKLAPPGEQTLTLRPQQFSSAHIGIPLHPDKIRVLLESRQFSQLHLERLVPPSSQGDQDIFTDELVRHCQNCRAFWLTLLDQLHTEQTLTIPKTEIWTLLKTITGLRLNIILQSQTRPSAPVISFLAILKSLQTQLLKHFY